MAKVRKRRWTSKAGDREAWLVDYKDGAGKRHVATFRTRKLADAARRRIEGEVDKGIHTPASRSVTIADAGATWLQQAETDGLERSTLQQYR